MTKSVFTKQFDEAFGPSVKKFNIKQNLSKNTLIILDNYLGHYNDDFNSKNILNHFMFLPSYVTLF